MSFQYSTDGKVQVWTDGSCLSNGQENARAGIGVNFGEGHPLNVSRPLAGHSAHTNNNAEIQAASEAIERASQAGVRDLQINTDSDFVRKAATEWMPTWKDNGWKTSRNQEVKNRQEFQRLDQAISDSRMNITWRHVPGHSGNAGNESADGLARQGAQGRRY